VSVRPHHDQSNQRERFDSLTAKRPCTRSVTRMSVAVRGNPHRLEPLDSVRVDIRLFDPVALTPHATGYVVLAVRVTEARGIAEATAEAAMIEAVMEMLGVCRSLTAAASAAGGVWREEEHAER